MRRIVVLLGGALLAISWLIPPVAGGQDLFVGSGTLVFHYDRDGDLHDILPTGTSGTTATDMAHDFLGRFIHVVNKGPGLSPGSVSVFDGSGNFLTSEWGGPFTSNLQSIESHGDRYYLAERTSPGRLLHLDQCGEIIGIYQPPLGTGTGLAVFTARGNTLIYSTGGALLRRFDLSTGTALTDFASLPEPPTGPLRKAGGHLLAVGSDAVYRYDAGGTLVRTYLATDLGSEGGLRGLASSDSFFWTTSPDPLLPPTWIVYKVRLVDGAVVQTIDELPLPINGIALYNPAGPAGVPLFDHSSGCGVVNMVDAGSTISFVISARANDVLPVTLSSGPLPAGASMDPPLPITGMIVSSTFTWTPTEQDVGTHKIAFGGAGLCCRTIVVESDPTATLISFFRAEPIPEGVELRWEWSEESADVVVERREVGLDRWIPVAPERSLEGRMHVALDGSVAPGRSYDYRLRAMGAQGQLVTLAEARIEIAPRFRVAPTVLSSGPLEIVFQALHDGRVRLRLLDAQGREVARILDEIRSVGTHRLEWRPRTSGRPLPSGIYWVEFRDSRSVESRKIIVTQ